MGFATGKSMGDVLKGKYVAQQPRVAEIPALGQDADLVAVFYLHDRFPEIKRPRGLAGPPADS